MKSEINLKDVLNHSKNCLQSRAILRSVLLDLYPGAFREINNLLDVYESGIPRRIKEAGDITEAQYVSYIQKIVDMYGLQEKFAEEALDSWIMVCLGHSINEKKRIKVKTKDEIVIQNNEYVPTPEKLPGFKAPQAVISKNDLDYDIKAINSNEIIIVKFNGFDEKELYVPNTIKGQRVIGIGENAYKDCSKIEKIIIPEGIEYIENGVFANCISLKEVILPGTLKRIGSNDDNQNGYYRTLRLLQKNSTGTFENTSIKGIELPTSLQQLGAKAFLNCQSLESIDIPNGIQEVKPWTFWNCSSLVRIAFSNSVNRIGYSAFSKCTSLQTVRMPDSMISIGERAFADCSILENVYLNEGLKSIGDEAFENCRLMKTIVLPSTLTSLGLGKKIFNIHQYHTPYDRRRNGYFTDNNNPHLIVYCYSGSAGLSYARSEGFLMEDASKP